MSNILNIAATTGTQTFEGAATVAGINMVTASAAITECSIYDGSSVGNTGLVTNTSFGSDTGWTLAPGWAIADGVATHTSGTGTMTYAITVTAGDLYKVTFTVGHASSLTGSVVMSIGAVNGSTRSTKATFTEYIKATGTTTLTFTPSNDFDGNIDNVIVERISDAKHLMYTGKFATTAESKMVNFIPSLNFKKGIFSILTGAGATATVYIV